MEIKRNLFLLCVLLGLTVSTNSMQASQYQNLLNTTNTLDLKGPVKTLNYNSDIYGMQILEFDSFGYLTKGKFLYPDTNQAARQAMESEFSEHQRIYIYDENKNLLEIQKEPLNTAESMSEGIKYHYNNKTPHFSLEETSLTNNATRLFFDNGKLSKEVVFIMTKGKLLPETHTYNYQYDTNGQLELTKKQMLETTTKQRIIRNDKGFIKEVRFSWNDLHGNHEVKFLYEYSGFDRHGNWTERTVTIADSGSKEAQTQEITYYSKD